MAAAPPIRAAAGAAMLLLAGLAAGSAGDMFGLLTDRRSPDEISALISPYYRVFNPEGGGPAPTAILLSGCDGPQDNLYRWADALTRDGWAAVIVDSHTPRDMLGYQKWRLVCAGQILPGAERAGDLAVALADVRRMDFVDPDRILLVGASHGAWTILDMLALEKQGGTPFNLSRWPEGFAAGRPPGVFGAVLLYPYCGFASQVRRSGWNDGFPLLFLLVDNDRIADEDACKTIITDMADSGRRVEMHEFDGVTHGFDQQTKAPLSTLEFDPRTTEEAIGIVRAFIDRTMPR